MSTDRPDRDLLLAIVEEFYDTHLMAGERIFLKTFKAGAWHVYRQDVEKLIQQLRSGDPGVAVAPPPRLLEAIEDLDEILGQLEFPTGLGYKGSIVTDLREVLAALRAVAPPRCPECNHPVASHLQRGYCEESSIAGPVGTHCSCTLRDMENRIRINSGQLGVWEADGRAIVTERALRAVAPPQCETCRHPPAYVPTVGQRACLCGCHASVRAVAPPQERI